MNYYNQEFNKYANPLGAGANLWARLSPYILRLKSLFSRSAPKVRIHLKLDPKSGKILQDATGKAWLNTKGKKALKALTGVSVTGATVGDLFYNVKNQADQDAVKAAVGALDENQKLKQYIVQNAMNSVTPTGIPEIDAAKAKELADQFEIGKLFDISSPYAQYYTLPTAAGATLGGLLYGGKGSAIGGVGGLGLGLLAKAIVDSQNKSTANTPTLSA